MTRAEILKQAEQIVCQDRESQYGSPEDNFAKIAEYWSIYLESKITAHDVAMMMIFLKTARISTGKFKDDNYIDLCGYAACAGEIGGKETNCFKAILGTELYRGKR